MQKIVRVREGESIRELDDYTETWTVVKVLGEAPRQEDQSEWVHWIYVLLERDEEASAEKLAKHESYLRVVDRLRLPHEA
jgi:hypothetical protein